MRLIISLLEALWFRWNLRNMPDGTISDAMNEHQDRYPDHPDYQYRNAQREMADREKLGIPKHDA